MNQVAHQAPGAYPNFCSMKVLGVLLPPLDGMLVHLGYPFVHFGGESH